MDDALTQAIATLMGAITTAILMAATYYWGPRRGGNGSGGDEGKRERRYDRGGRRRGDSGNASDLSDAYEQGRRDGYEEASGEGER